MTELEQDRARMDLALFTLSLVVYLVVHLVAVLR